MSRTGRVRAGAGLTVLLLAAGLTAGPGRAMSMASPAAVASTQAGQPRQAVALKPKGDVVSGVLVERVVDGDTLEVSLGGATVVVRMIGINTPETVKPEFPVECFGPQASAFTKAALTGRTVTLEFDASQGRTDQYGRTLAYVWVPGQGGRLRLFNRAAVAGGYAVERQYGPTPYAWKKAFRAAQRGAQRAGRGLWGACPG